MEAGFGCRSSQVYYDRGQSSLEAIQVDHFDMEQLFLEVGLVHFSGITVAIGSAVRAWLVQVLKEAKRRKIPISMDLNWRSKMIGLRDAKKCSRNLRPMQTIVLVWNLLWLMKKIGNYLKEIRLLSIQ